MPNKNIGYSQFLKLCNVDDPRDWYGMAVRPDGVWVKPPSDDVLLLPSERAALSEHPKNDLTIPALALPCSIGELQQFLDWLSNYCGSSIEPVELPKKESETQPINEPSSSYPSAAGAYFNSIQPDGSKVSIALEDIHCLNKRRPTLQPQLIERDKAKERALWKKHIEPIIIKHNLRTKEGNFFQYEFYPKDIYNDDVLSMLRRTMYICRSIEFPKAEVLTEETNDPFEGADDFIDEILRRLRDGEKGPQKYCLKDRGQIDLRDTFRDCLDELFTKQTLPEFLELLHWEFPTAKAETEAIQYEIDDVERIQLIKGAGYDNLKPCLDEIRTISEKDIGSFISSLIVSYIDNTEVKIQYKGKRMEYTCKSMGFRDSTTKEWQTFLEILEAEDHFYRLGPAHYYNKEIKQKKRIEKYDNRLSLLKVINKKLISFLTKQYNAEFPPKFKLYELQPAEGKGVYSFKFQIPSDKPSYKTKEQAVECLTILIRNSASEDEIQQAALEAMEAGITSDKINEIVQDFIPPQSGNHNISDKPETENEDDVEN